MLHKILKGVAPVFAVALAAGLTACDGNITINGDDGVPLAELDTAGKTPTGVVLAGPDDVVVTRGSALDIDVSGDREAVDALRFTLKDDTLGVMRKNGDWKTDGKATVRVTLPALEKVTVAGSGTLAADHLGGKAEVVIAGSGRAETNNVDAESLEVTIAGSGSYGATGRAKTLELNVAGSGKADMAGLKVDDAEITVAGSGDAAFASDGTVKATVMGSGDISVTGTAKCTIKSMGSGKLHCSAGTASGEGPAPSPPEAPTPPAAPEAPEAPGAP